MNHKKEPLPSDPEILSKEEHTMEDEENTEFYEKLNEFENCLYGAAASPIHDKRRLREEFENEELERKLNK